MKNKYSLMIHGGAGELDHIRNRKDTKPYLDSIQMILEQGRKILKHGGSAMNAVETCVVMLEDNPLFNAGRGAVLNEHGKVELDAAIMDGCVMNAGSTAGLTRIKNPVSLARMILEKSNHVMLTDVGATKFARENNIKIVSSSYFITEKRLEEYKKEYLKHRIPEKRKHGTTGAVAQDRKGNLAAATSTGGLTGKKQGRVGDSPIIGAGVYADNKTCAVSATGHGEMFMRTVLAKYIADLIELKKIEATAATKLAIAYLRKKVDGHGGVIVIDRYGNCSASFNTRTMIHGWIEKEGETYCSIK